MDSPPLLRIIYSARLPHHFTEQWLGLCPLRRMFVMKKSCVPSEKVAVCLSAMSRHTVQGVDLRRLSQWILMLLAFCSVASCKPSTQPAEQPKLIVAVVGSGIPTREPPPKRETPLNRAQGIAMWNGASAAYNDSPRARVLKEKVELFGYDDGGSPAYARQRAQLLLRDPRVLAVVGHATSGTTRQAGWLYAQGGIPFLMPIATARNAIYRPGENPETSEPLLNFLRLPPPDDRVQAPAIAYLIRKVLGLTKCCLVLDESPNAVEYAKPLYDALDSLLANEIVHHASTSSTDSMITQVADDAHDLKADVVVFIGYGVTADRLMGTMRRRYANVDLAKRPVVVLADGARNKVLDPSGFQVYLTFPLRDLSEYACDAKDGPILAKSVSTPEDQSYQMFGYDAVLILADAVDHCVEEGISRRCVLDYVRNLGLFHGACVAYNFSAGENTIWPYYVYANTLTEDGSSTLRYRFELRPQDFLVMVRPPTGEEK